MSTTAGMVAIIILVNNGWNDKKVSVWCLAQVVLGFVKNFW